mgnify:CR=1 FL=1
MEQRNLIAELAEAEKTCAAVAEMLMREAKEGSRERLILDTEAKMLYARVRGFEQDAHWPMPEKPIRTRREIPRVLAG